MIRRHAGASTRVSDRTCVDRSLTATSTAGIGEIYGIAASSTPIELTVSKPGCDRASFTSYPHTGRYVLENGAVTLAGVFLPAVPSP